MRFPGFIGPSYKHSSVNVDCQSCINMYLEANELGRGKEQEPACLVRVPGKRLLLTVGDGPIRGEWFSSNGRAFVVSGNKLYELSSSFTATERGTLTTNSGPVSMADNGVRLAIVDGSTNGFYFKFSDNSFTAIDFPEEINFKTFAGTDQVVYYGKAFVFNHKGNGEFFISGLVGSIVADETTFDALDFKEVESSPDELVGILTDRLDLWFAGRHTIEIWFNSGAADFPFERNQGAFVEVGLAARFSLAKMNNSVFWLGYDENGQGMVFQAQGSQPKRISTHPIEQEIQSYGDISDARAWTYQQDGHYFYILSFPSVSKTWAFDSTTGLWHERAYLSNGQLYRDRADCHMFAFKKHIVGDYENGNIYELTREVMTDNDQPIMRRRRAPHLTADLDWVFYSLFELDAQMGVGLDGVGQGTDPQVMLRFSDDGGHTWSNEKWASLGKIGQTKSRARWRRLGKARDRVFEVTITDPVDVVLIGAKLEFEKGAS
jgi:hypothetical protein